MNEYPEALIARLYRALFLIRRVEERIAEVYYTDVIKSPVHLSIGQEAVAVGVCDALLPMDKVANTYRCHATYLAKGGDLRKMMAELYGKQTGCAAGKAGSMHLIDMANGVMGASAVVGTTIPVGVGYALALKQQFQQQNRPADQSQPLVAVIFGDGATEEGVFYETLNFAALHRLPVIFICENNQLAINTPLSKRWSTEKLCERVASYGITTQKIEEGDIFKIRAAISEAAKAIRSHYSTDLISIKSENSSDTAKSGPYFFEIATYRWLEHVGPLDDHHEAYRDKEVYAKWKQQDQLPRLAQMLDATNSALRKSIEDDVLEAIKEAERFAINSEFPTVEELYSHVYAN